MAIPTQDNCDLGNPREAFLWMLVSVSNSNVPLLFPRQVMEDISERIWRAGGRYHPELQEIYYQPAEPVAGESMWEAMGGQWVEADTPGERPEALEPSKVAEIVDALDDRVKHELRKELERRGF